MFRGRNLVVVVLLVVLSATIGAGGVLVTESFQSDTSRSAISLPGQPSAKAQATPYLVNHPSYNDALKACGYKGPTDLDGSLGQCMATRYNYVFPGTKTISKAVQTTEASGSAGMADRVEALQAEVTDIEQQINVINGPTNLGELHSEEDNSTVSAQIQEIQNAIQELQTKQQLLCSAVMTGFSYFKHSVCQ